MKTKNKFEIGIDLGTTFSEVGYRNGAGIPEIIPGLDGKLKMESIVSYASGKPIVGADAKLDLVLAPKYVVKCGKRHMGKDAADHSPIPILTDPSGRQITAVDFSAAVLSRLRQSAEAYLGGKVEDGVITVPAYFGEIARNHTKAAAKIAGFKNVRLLDEPVSAALFYTLSKGVNETVAVVDFGGGTLDVTAVEIKDSDVKAIVTDGDSELGGANFDEVVLELMSQAAKKAGFEISAEFDLAGYYQNLARATEAKESLGQREEVVVLVEGQGKRTILKLTRKMLKEASSQLNKRFLDCCKRVLKELESKQKKLTRVLLVGGSSRLFNVPEMVEKVFGIKPSRDTDPDMAITKGAIIWAEACFGNGDEPININGHKYLAAEIKVETVTAHALCIAARRTAKTNDPYEYNVPIIPANSALPCEFEEHFAPMRPDQKSVVVKIIQGKPDEQSDTSTLLRKIDVPINPSDKDTNRILVKGRYTAEGILEITIIDEIRNEPVTDSFAYKAGLSSAEIDKKIEQLKA